MGDHHCFIGEVTNAATNSDAKLLTLEECGVKYGG